MGWPKGKPRGRPHPPLAPAAVGASPSPLPSPSAVASPAEGEFIPEQGHDHATDPVAIATVGVPLLSMGADPVVKASDGERPEPPSGAGSPRKEASGSDILMERDGVVTEVHRASVATMEGLGWRRHGSNH